MPESAWAGWLAAFVVKRGRWLILAGLLLSLGACGYAWAGLGYNNDRTQMLGQGDAAQRSFETYRRQFPDLEFDAVVLVGGSSEESRHLALERLSQALGRSPQLFPASIYRVPVGEFERASLLGLPQPRLDHLEQQLRDSLPLVQEQKAGGMPGLLRYLTRLPGAELARLAPLLEGVLGQLHRSFADRGSFRYRSPWDSGFAESPLRGGTLYLSLGSANFLIVQLAPERAGEALARLEQELQGLRPGFPGLTFDLVGDYATKTEDGRVSRNSALGCACLSLVLVKALFLLTAARRRRPQLALLALFSGLSWSLAWATLTVGQLNLVSVNFAATLVGLGMDFAIHLLFRYEEGIQSDGGPEEGRAVRVWTDTMVTAGRENLVGALATAAAFLSLCLTPFRGVQQLGWVSGSGMVWVFLAMMVLFPALLCRYGQHSPEDQPSHIRLGWLVPLEEGWRRGAVGVLVAAALFTLIAALGIPRLSFDANLLHMSWPDSLANRSESAFRRYASCSCLFLVSIAEPAELSGRVEALGKLPGVARVESLSSLVAIASPTRAQRQRVESIVATAHRFPALPAPRSYNSQELLDLRDQMPPLLQRLDRILADEPQTSDVDRLRHLLTDLKSATRGLGPGSVQEALLAFEEGWWGDVRARMEFLQSQTAEPPDLESLPSLLLHRYRSASGRWLVKIYPGPNIWEEAELRKFVEPLRAVDPEVTGTPILTQRYLELLNDGYRKASWMALSVIVLLLLAYFRSLRQAALALLPKLLGLTWMLGLLGWWGASLNPANATALPITMGVGLVFGVHVLHRCLHDPHTPVFQGSTGAAVAVSAASTILGYAALTLAPHRGIASLGWVMGLGVGANLVAAVVVLPCLLHCLARTADP